MTTPQPGWDPGRDARTGFRDVPLVLLPLVAIGATTCYFTYPDPPTWPYLVFVAIPAAAVWAYLLFVKYWPRKGA